MEAETSMQFVFNQIKQEVDSTQECIVCLQNCRIYYNIFTTSTRSSGCLIHAFLSQFTNTELPFYPNLVKYICGTCYSLINVLERAEMEYRKVKSDFDSIIRQNPLFYLSHNQHPKTEEAHSDGETSNIRDELIPEDLLQCQIMVKEIKEENCNNGEYSESINTIVKLEPIDVDTVLETEESGAEKQDTDRETLCQATEDPLKLANLSERQTKGQTASTERRHECPVCQRRFNLKHHLKDHIKIHTGEKSHYCHVCAYRCSRKDDFIRHLRTHTGEKPFQCEICQNRFSLKSHLTEHIRTHTGEKPYQCDVCQRRFNYRHVLKSHARVHTSEKPYECQICQKKFGQRSHLKSHLKIHTGEKPYQCTVCENRFNRKTSLEEHLRTHSSDKPYQCGFCQRRCRQRSNLLKHVKTHHPSIDQASVA